MNSLSGTAVVRSRLVAIRETRIRLIDEVRAESFSRGAWRPEGGWALQDVIEHLVLAERGGFDSIWKAAEALRAGSPIWEGVSENEGQTIEEIVARTWAVREKAPPSAEPTGSGSLSSWIAHLKSCDALLESLPDHLEGLPLERVIYPHFLSGPLNAIQRLDFIRFHMQHHLPQVRRIKDLQER